jgi:hypothetical protein
LGAAKGIGDFLDGETLVATGDDFAFPLLLFLENLDIQSGSVAPTGALPVG